MLNRYSELTPSSWTPSLDIIYIPCVALTLDTYTVD
jgi:hypothetical protein